MMSGTPNSVNGDKKLSSQSVEPGEAAVANMVDMATVGAAVAADMAAAAKGTNEAGEVDEADGVTTITRPPMTAT